MPYDKSEGTRRYNKEERGGWYCTNPKKHDEGLQHHGAEAPHEHRAERNDVDPVRQPEARHGRPIRKPEMPKVEPIRKPEPKPQPKPEPKPEPTTVKLPEDGSKKTPQLQKSGCGCVAFFMALPFIFGLIGLCSEMGETDSGDNDYSYDESYYEDSFEYEDNEADSAETITTDSVSILSDET